MKNIKYLVIAIACLITAAGFAGFDKNPITETVGANGSPTPTPGPRLYTETKQIPDELAYLTLFEEIQALKEKDLEFQAQGENTSFKNSFYTNRFGLASSQFSAIDTIATNCLNNIQPIDQRAREIITQYRAPYPNGQLKKKTPTASNQPQSPFEDLPPVPPELDQLQNQKKQAVLAAREQIKQSLGQNSFSAFNTAVQKNAVRVLEPLNFGTNTLPRLTQSPIPGN